MEWLTTRPIAHRGLHRGRTIPENSLAAFAAAIAANHPIELDIQRLADGQIAVFHDKDLYRLTGQPGRIASQTADRLRQFPLYDTDQTIPTLVEALDLIAGQVPVLIEIKSDGQVGPLETALLEILTSYRGELAIQSFNPLSLQWFRQQAPAIVRGQLSSGFKGQHGVWPYQLLLSQMLINWGSAPHFMAYNVKTLPNLTTTLIRRAFHLPLLAWTIRTERDRKRAEAWADNYIFDAYPPPKRAKKYPAEQAGRGRFNCTFNGLI